MFVYIFDVCVYDEPINQIVCQKLGVSGQFRGDGSGRVQEESLFALQSGSPAKTPPPPPGTNDRGARVPRPGTPLAAL